VAAALNHLGNHAGGRTAAQLFQRTTLDYLDKAIGNLEAIVAALDPNRSELARTVMSPVGLVHLFRQYFFELDSFLGPAVEHLWLSPGGRVKLVEVSTVKTTTERLTEIGGESLFRTERRIVVDDEISEAVRRQNESSTRFGVSVNTEASFSLGSIFTSEIGAGTSYDLAETMQEAREALHKATRQQTEFLASEMKRTFRASFRTTTEETDSRSRSYTISNTGTELVNYELRRKMRQVAVQMQDHGTYLCWQTYVDRPGDELGIANLVHISVPNDMPPPVHPDLPPDPVPYRGETLKLHYRWPLGDPTSGIGFQGVDPEHLRDVVACEFPVIPAAGFRLDRVELKILSGLQWAYQWRPVGGSERPVGPGAGESTPTAIQLYHPPNIWDDGIYRQPLTDEHPEWDFELTPMFVPSNWLLDKVAEEAAAKWKEANQARELEYKQKLYAAIKERVKLASHVERRPFTELRDEERIIVYRNLIRQLMNESGVAGASAHLQHLFAEVVQSMFDVDKMLYFVAPEWWAPRNRTAGQEVFRPGVDAAEFTTYSTVRWGGGESTRDDNYLITQDSAPAPLGSSLGWVIQLDGDNLRNAFLNAPWVKAIVPIRPGKEARALDWLKGAQVEGTDGLDGALDAPADELDRIRSELGLSEGATVTIGQALEALTKRLAERHATARARATDQTGAELDHVPLDHVYEHGFEPLQGGFRITPAEDFEVFDQWVEVVPTDQIVPVEVSYDPHTGRLV
jgi:hypothetical protein